MSKKYSSTYSQIKNARLKKCRSTLGFSLFSKRKSEPKRIRSEADRAGAIIFGNPYRSRQRGILLPKINKKTIYFISFLAIVALWFSVLAKAPYFNISETRVTGLKNIKIEEIQPYIDQYLAGSKFYFLKNANFFISSESDFSDLLRQHFYVENIQITKVFPNQVNIDIQEKMSSLIYDNGREYVILDDNGTVVKQIKMCVDECANSNEASPYAASTMPDVANATTTMPVRVDTTLVGHKPKYDTFALEYLNIPVIYDSKHKDVSVGSKFVLLPDSIATIESIYSKARKNEKKYSILYFVLEKPGSGVQAITDKGYSIFFSLENNLDNQFNFIRVVLKDNKPQEYIDGRYANRVFWK